MKGIEYKKLIDPTAEIAGATSRWQNDTELVPFIRHSASKQESEKKLLVTVDDLQERLRTHCIYLIYLEGDLVGEMNYQVDSLHCYQKANGTAWIGIIIGEKRARHRGIGHDAIGRIEDFTYWNGQMWQDIRMEKYL